MQVKINYVFLPPTKDRIPISNMKVITDNGEYELLESLSKGNSKAFDIIFISYYPKVKKYINGFIHDEVEAENISQDIFMRLWDNRSNAKNIMNLNSYLYMISRNESLKVIAKSIKYKDISEVANIYNPESTDNDTFYNELLDVIQHEIDKMPERQKQVFEMSRRDGMSNDEIAKTLNISKRTVEKHICNALTDLKKVLLIYIATLIYIF